MAVNKIWTGERLETYIYNETTIEHLHRYALAIEFVKNKTVLDIACGEGYGSKILSRYADKIYGVDKDKMTIKKANEKYKCPNIEFKVGSADSLPLDNNSVDIVTSFETLEHHDKHQEMMKEIVRVLKPHGILFISTPDKKHYSDGRNYQNPFHVKELYVNEFKELLNFYFTNSKFYFQKIFKGSLIIPESESKGSKTFEGNYKEIEYTENFEPMYVIAIASNKQLNEEINISMFNGINVETKMLQEMQSKMKEITRKETIEWMENSWNFRIGKILLSPLRIFKK